MRENCHPKLGLPAEMEIFRALIVIQSWTSPPRLKNENIDAKHPLYTKNTDSLNELVDELLFARTMKGMRSLKPNTDSLNILVTVFENVCAQLSKQDNEYFQDQEVSMSRIIEMVSKAYL